MSKSRLWYVLPIIFGLCLNILIYKLEVANNYRFDIPGYKGYCSDYSQNNKVPSKLIVEAGFPIQSTKQYTVQMQNCEDINKLLLNNADNIKPNDHPQNISHFLVIWQFYANWIILSLPTLLLTHLIIKRHANTRD